MRLLVVALLFVAACGDDGGDTSAKTCTELFSDGVNADAAVRTGEQQGCDGSLVGTAKVTCENGTVFLHNDYGWAYPGDRWNASEDVPDDVVAKCYGVKERN